MTLRTISTIIGATALAAGLGVGAAHAAPTSAAAGSGESQSATTAVATRPMLRVPFNCGRVWRTATGSHHQDFDGYHSVDMNWGSGDDDFGTPVLASASGTAQVTISSGGYGRHVVVNHGGGWSTLYAHLSSVNVSDNQSVGPKTILGRLGESGSSTAPHLHYAQKLNNVVKPIKFGTSTWLNYPSDTVERIRDCR